MRLPALLVLTALALTSASSLAAEKSTDRMKDPNRIICKTEQSLESRLKRERRCATAAEWEEMKRAERLVIDRIQSQRADKQ